ncbi:MAG TPA: cellulose binding domain-containing protein [Kineosporiaceae bacterium]|nr:cellulose binding domain-containing protein [Kineosporiaceae bacterium]
MALSNPFGFGEHHATVTADPAVGAQPTATFPLEQPGAPTMSLSPTATATILPVPPTADPTSGTATAAASSSPAKNGVSATPKPRPSRSTAAAAPAAGAAAAGAAAAVPVPGCTYTYLFNSRSAGGFQATVTLKNTSSRTLSSWTAGFNLSDGITVTSSWGADVSHNGNYAQVTPPGYNAILGPGDSLSFGFNADTPGGEVNGLDGFTLAGVPCGRA